MLNIINADAKRWICSRRFFINIVAIFFVNYLVLSQNVMKELLATNIVYDVDICMEDPFFTMNFILSSMVFGTAYYEEKKNGFLKFCKIRCSNKEYIISKITNCFMSAFMVLFIGLFLWILSLRLFLPWADLEGNVSDSFQVVSSLGMGQILNAHHFILYYILYSVGIGMIGGILAVITLLCSLFINNAMVVEVIPAILYYLSHAYLDNISEKAYFWSLEQVLYFPNSLLKSPVLILLKGMGYTSVIVVITGFVCWKVFDNLSDIF